MSNFLKFIHFFLEFFYFHTVKNVYKVEMNQKKIRINSWLTVLLFRCNYSTYSHEKMHTHVKNLFSPTKLHVPLFQFGMPRKNSIHFFREGRFSETPLFPYFNHIKYFTKIVKLFFRRNITPRKH